PAVVGGAATATGAGKAATLVPRDGDWVPATHGESPPASLPSLTGPEVRCTDASAAGWECHDVDLVAFLPVSAIGGVRGMRLNDLWGWTDSTTGREYIKIGRASCRERGCMTVGGGEGQREGEVGGKQR